MSQNQELEAIKEKIRKLAAQTVDAGCTEHQANKAMEVIGKLLEQYSLTMEEVDVRGEKFVTRVIKTGARKKVLDGYTQGLGKLTSCKVWISYYFETRTTKTYNARLRRMVEKTGSVRLIQYNVFGHESDTLAFEYLYNTIEAALATELKKFSKDFGRGDVRGEKKVATESFKRYYRGRINRRCNDLKSEIEYSLNHAQSTGTALVLLKDKLVEEAYHEETKSLRLRTTKYYHNRQVNWDAAHAGSEAGKKVNLQRPVANGGRNQLYLK